jgi:hypothetical protein
MAAGDAECFVDGGVVVQVIVDAVAPHIAPAIGAEQSLDGFFRARVVERDGLLVDQERHRVIRNQAVVPENKGERLDIRADNRHGNSPGNSPALYSMEHDHWTNEFVGAAKTIVRSCRVRGVNGRQPLTFPSPEGE